MTGRKAFHDLGFKMGDGVFAFWKFAHKSEPVVVYSVILGAVGIYLALAACTPPTSAHAQPRCNPAG